MEKTNDGGPAFPIFGFDSKEGKVCHFMNGMTLRDYFAGHAVVGIALNTKDTLELDDKDVYTTLAIMAYRTADAMLKERSK